MSSVTGKMLFEFGVTATVAILLSMVISFTLTPMMCSRLLRPIRKVEGKATANSRSGFYGWIEWSVHGIAATGHAISILDLVALYRDRVGQIFRSTNGQARLYPDQRDESEFEVASTPKRVPVYSRWTRPCRSSKRNCRRSMALSSS